MSIIELDRTKIAVISQMETAIAGLREQYMGLTIAGPDDRKGYLAVSEARKDVKARRVKVEHGRKALKEDALAYGKLVDGEAKRITAMLEPIEKHLQDQEDGYAAAREAIKRKEAEAKQAALQARVDALGAVGGSIPIAVLQALTDEQFAAELATATEAHAAKVAKEEAERKERERIEAEQAEQRRLEAERIKEQMAKLEAERKAQEEQSRKEREKLEAERKAQQAIIDAERRKQEEAQQQLEAEQRKLREERERLERAEFERQAKAKAEQEAREKVERERLEAERKEAELKEREAAEAARLEAMKPDLQKLREYVATVEAVPIPEVADKAVAKQLYQFAHQIGEMAESVDQWCDEQTQTKGGE